MVIELVNGERPHLSRLSASLSDCSTAGSLMAERAANLVHASGADPRVFLLTGDPYNESHYLTARAFHDYLRERDISWQVEDLAATHAQAMPPTAAVNLWEFSRLGGCPSCDVHFLEYSASARPE